MSIHVNTYTTAKPGEVIIVHKTPGGCTLTIGEGTFSSVHVTPDLLLEIASWLDETGDTPPSRPVPRDPTTRIVRIAGRSMEALTAIAPDTIAGWPGPYKGNSGRGISYQYRVTSTVARGMAETLLQVRDEIDGTNAEGARTRGSLKRDAVRIEQELQSWVD